MKMNLQCLIFCFCTHTLLLDFTHVDQPAVGREVVLVVVLCAQECACPGAYNCHLSSYCFSKKQQKDPPLSPESGQLRL